MGFAALIIAPTFHYPPGKYYYRYLIDGEVILDDGPVENGFNVLKLGGGVVRRVRGVRRRLFRAIYGDIR
ncbi:hypothetical protein [Vulcanisaeta distributa]|uniref:hypothetical protein n=1 Tax=Vulcanisaeta distributa TaxID=164451 RepID=UPI001FB2808B|nr:hypothetical protein [Vulcanisaeta distributa]